MKANVRIRNTGVTVVQVLKMISEGYSNDKILKAHRALTMSDILASADLARRVIEQLGDEQGELEIGRGAAFVVARGEPVSLDRLREKHPRAWRPWSGRDDNQLVEMRKVGLSLNQMSEQLGRQPGAVRIRLDKLALMR
jgi:hypothetical protein